MSIGKEGIATKKLEVCNHLIKLDRKIVSFLGNDKKVVNFNKQFLKNYYSIIPISIIAKDEKWISAYYWDESKEEEIYFEIFKYKYPDGTELKAYRGYSVLTQGSFEKGSILCDKLGLNFGGDSAPRFLWRHLNKIADKTGVELHGVTYEEFLQ